MATPSTVVARLVLKDIINDTPTREYSSVLSPNDLGSAPGSFRRVQAVELRSIAHT